MSVMTASQFVLSVDRPLTVADLDLTPDDGRRYELDDGVLVVSPAPMPIHQRVLHRLQVCLQAACPAEFEVLPGPGVQLSEIQYRIPDLDNPSIMAYGLTGGTYAEVGRAVGKQRFIATTPFPVEIVPAELVAGPWRH
jgi:hypothetical protein